MLLFTSLSRQAFDLDFPPGVTMGGVDADDLTNGEQNAPSIFSSAGLSAGAFLKSPYVPRSNDSAPDIQVCAKKGPPTACYCPLTRVSHGLTNACGMCSNNQKVEVPRMLFQNVGNSLFQSRIRYS